MWSSLARLIIQKTESLLDLPRSEEDLKKQQQQGGEVAVTEVWIITKG